MKITGVTSVLLLALILANTSASQAQARMVLRPGEFCSGQPGAAVATFEDARLEAAIRARLSLDAERDLTCSLVSGLTDLTAQNAGIESLVGIQNLTGLTDLELNTNSITDISPLSGLTSLTELALINNSISDISPLSGLTSLETLFLGMNSITDISPLSGLTSLRWLELWYNSITDISALSGLTKLGGPGRELHAQQQPRPQQHPASARQHRARSGRYGLSQQHERELRGRSCAGSQGSDGGVRLSVNKAH